MTPGVANATAIAMSMLTAPPRPREMNFLPAETSRVPFRNSTRAPSAALTSEARFESRGLTSTTVVIAVRRDDMTDPLTTSTEAVIGSGVGNVGIFLS